jgi:hypothetical protein
MEGKYHGNGFNAIIIWGKRDPNITAMDLDGCIWTLSCVGWFWI